MRPMQTGEVLRRVVFNALDAAKGGKLKKLKEVNKSKIIEATIVILLNKPAIMPKI